MPTQFPRLGHYGEISFNDGKEHRLQVFDVSKLPLGAVNHELPEDVIATLIKKYDAPLGLIGSKYYLSQQKGNVWTVSTSAPAKAKFDPHRVLVRH